MTNLVFTMTNIVFHPFIEKGIAYPQSYNTMTLLLCIVYLLLGFVYFGLYSSIWKSKNGNMHMFHSLCCLLMCIILWPVMLAIGLGAILSKYK